MFFNFSTTRARRRRRLLKRVRQCGVVPGAIRLRVRARRVSRDLWTAGGRGIKLWRCRLWLIARVCVYVRTYIFLYYKTRVFVCKYTRVRICRFAHTPFTRALYRLSAKHAPGKCSEMADVVRLYLRPRSYYAFLPQRFYRF